MSDKKLLLSAAVVAHSHQQLASCVLCKAFLLMVAVKSNYKNYCVNSTQTGHFLSHQKALIQAMLIFDVLKHPFIASHQICVKLNKGVLLHPCYLYVKE